MIDERINELGDWRQMRSRLRTLIKQADPEVVEERKWDSSGVVSRRIDLHRRDLQARREDDLCEGAALEDPSGLFNSSLDGNTRRAIDFHEGEKIDEKALKALIRAAVTLNASAPAADPRTLGFRTPTRRCLGWPCAETLNQ